MKRHISSKWGGFIFLPNENLLAGERREGKEKFPVISSNSNIMK